jgi:hypothetical protein
VKETWIFNGESAIRKIQIVSKSLKSVYITYVQPEGKVDNQKQKWMNKQNKKKEMKKKDQQEM